MKINPPNSSNALVQCKQKCFQQASSSALPIELRHFVHKILTPFLNLKK